MSKSIRFPRWIRLAIALLVALLAAAGLLYGVGEASLWPAANRLVPNPGFDEMIPPPYPPDTPTTPGFYNPPGVNGRVAVGWNVLLENGNPTFFSSCEEINNCADPNGSEKLSGTSSQFIKSEASDTVGKPFKIDLYQTAVVTTPGVAWSVSGFMVSFCGGTDPAGPVCSASYTIGKSIGLDPYGGTDPNAPSVIWTPEDGRNALDVGWVRLTNVVYARSPSMTVFLRMNWPYTHPGAIGWMDEMRLVPAPTAWMGYVAPLQNTNSFSVSAFGWRDSSFRSTGTYKIYWDIEARDVLAPTWYRILTDTTATPPLKDNTGVTTTFTGQFGHTYNLRAIPTVHQIPDCIDFCDWPEQVYLGFPSAPITVTIADNVPPVSAVAPLAPMQVTGTFAVSWSGSDNATPAYQLVYDIQSRDNGGAWTDWLTNTSATTAPFTGQPGHAYDFRSRAHDASNNVEAYPAVPDATTTVDGTPPQSSVALLAATQPLTGFSVRWSGSDNATPSNLLVYDIQSRDNGGSWVDWLTGTAATSASFSGQRGHTYDFRSRAHDLAGNAGAFPGAPDATTVVALAAVSGVARNLRDEPVAFPTAALSPGAALGGVGAPDGGYTLYVTTSATYALTVARAGFGSLPPIGGVVITTTDAAGVDAVLPPALDLAVNGQFENGDLTGWMATGEVTTTTAAHSGAYALALGATPGVESSITQTLYLSPTLNAPTLSYLVHGMPGMTQPFTLTVTANALMTQSVPVAGAGWMHGWLDLSAFAGQTITVTLAYQPGAPGQPLTVDEVSIGEAATVPVSRLYLPAILR